MFIKETVSILKLEIWALSDQKWEYVKILWTYPLNLPPRGTPSLKTWFTPYLPPWSPSLPPESKFQLSRGSFWPSPLEKKSSSSMVSKPLFDKLCLIFEGSSFAIHQNFLGLSLFLCENIFIKELQKRNCHGFKAVSNFLRI